MAKVLARAFRSLSVRNFRLFAAGQVMSVTGTWMMVVAQDWLVLDLTGSSASELGLVTALQFTPMLLLTLYGGRLADRYDKRMLLTAANLCSAVPALLLTLVVCTGQVRLWQLYAAALVLGVVNSVEVPTRMSFVADLVGPGLLPNASALSAAYFNVARVIGPAVAGVLITVLGMGWVMLLNAVSYLFTVAGLRMMRPAELCRAATAHERIRVSDGLRYIRSRTDLAGPLVLVAVIALFGLNFQLTLPLLARTVFDADALSFGLLTTALAAGALLGAFATTLRRGRPSSRLVAGSAVLFGALETAAGWAPTYASAVVLVFLTGFAQLCFVQAANHRIQLGSDARYRGRVLALYTLVLQGATPLGSLQTGWLAECWGARTGLWAGGLVSCAAGCAAVAVGRRAAERKKGTTPGKATAKESVENST